jgi:hypothetical protein
MSKGKRCLKCGNWLSYDEYTKEWFCYEDGCDYTESEGWSFKKKFRKELD